MRFYVRFKNADQKITVKSVGSQRITPKFKDFQRISVHENVEIYEGDYSVTPSVEAQTLPTNQKFMNDDVKIKEIPYFDVGNTAGGSTVYIGSEIEIN